MNSYAVLKHVELQHHEECDREGHTEFLVLPTTPQPVLPAGSAVDLGTQFGKRPGPKSA